MLASLFGKLCICSGGVPARHILLVHVTPTDDAVSWYYAQSNTILLVLWFNRGLFPCYYSYIPMRSPFYVISSCMLACTLMQNALANVRQTSAPFTPYPDAETLHRSNAMLCSR